MTAASGSTSVDAVQQFRRYLVSRRSARGAFGMRRFTGSASYPVEEVLEHSRHTAAAIRFFLAYDDMRHDYVIAALRFLLDRNNQTESGLWVEHGDRTDARVDPVTVGNVVESLELIHERMVSIECTSVADVSRQQIDEAIRRGIKHIIESPFRVDGMWLYRFSTTSEKQRVSSNKYRYTAGILRNIAKACRRTGLHRSDIIQLLGRLEEIASRYKGLPASEASNIPSLAATVNIAETRRYLTEGDSFPELVSNRLHDICLDTGVVAAGMAPGWAGMLSLAMEDEPTSIIPPWRLVELHRIGAALTKPDADHLSIPRELANHAALVEEILGRIREYRRRTHLGETSWL
jgi:hypothetical protein